jgi:actin-related protein
MSDSRFLSTFSAPHCSLPLRRNNSDQPGLVEAILSSINSVHPDFYGPLVENIIISGGCSKFPGFQARLARDLRSNTDQHITPGVAVKNEDDCVFEALNTITTDRSFEGIAMPKSMYSELGSTRMSALI